jgi:hypothetical protein
LAGLAEERVTLARLKLQSRVKKLFDLLRALGVHDRCTVLTSGLRSEL